MPTPDPLGPILGSLGDAAGGLAASAFDAALKMIWTFAMALLGGVLGVIDKYTQPNVDPTNGPLAGLLPMTLWLGLTVLVFMSFVQIGRAVARGGRGFARILIGLAQYVVISAAGLSLLATLIAASDSLSKFILQAGLHVDSWQGISATNSTMQNAVQGVSGVGLGLIALLCVIPAAFGFLVETLVRNAAILVLAATIPILGAGLVSDSTRRWFWTALRWMMALLMMTPAIALTIVIGMRLATGAAGAEGQHQDAVQATVGAVIAGIVLMISLCCPLAMFKLFAFVDPSSLSGSALRSFLAGRNADGAASGTASSSEQSAEAGSEGRFGQMLAALDVAGMGDRATNLAAGASGMLDTVGAGHPGGPDAVDESSASGGRPPEQQSDSGGEGGGQSSVTVMSSSAPAPPSGEPTGADDSSPAGTDTASAASPASPSTAVADGMTAGDPGASGSQTGGGQPGPSPATPGGAGPAGGAEVGGAEAAVIAI